MVKLKQQSKWVLLLVSVVLVFALTACGDTKDAAKETGQGTTPSETAATTEAPKSDVSLTLWHFKVAFDPGLKAVADAFKEKTGVTVVTQVTTPAETYNQKMTASATANSLPDLYITGAAPGAGAYDGRAMSWTEELEKDSGWKNSFFPAALSGVMVNQGAIDGWNADVKASDWQKARTVGEYYGIPIDVGAFYTIYGNAKLIEQAGLPTTAPASMEDWLENMKTVKEKTGVPGFVFSAKTFTVYENWMANFVDYMKNGPEEYTKFMNGESKMSDPAHIQAAQFIEDVTKSGNMIPGAVSLDIDPADQAFAQGKAAYSLGGTFTYASLTQMGMDPKDIISFRVPAYKGSKIPDAQVTPFALTQIHVKDKGSHQKEAIEFVKFLTSDEGMTLYANAAFDIPAVNIKNTDALNDTIKSMLNSLSSESNWFSENVNISNKIFEPQWNKFHEMKQKIILGAATAIQAAEAFDKATEAEKAKK
ncbi:ABC transporter substrate-binding protein [Cohnella abietis]|uniref:ABC transporter substrate-binding protein n=1 Tax=Cohnella abietis TaxID=2507935 RepID=A0A3T1D3R5_9BACL|nr:extracellular solute-binding protein [Cohnella abietis]BBI32760.1 hypothetical protein KCTCHS21_21590 [Cohnella abietis]